MAAKSSTYMVMEVGVRDGHPVSSMREVNKTIIEVLVARSSSRKITVVDPDIGRLLDRDGITVVSLNLGNLHVANDDVLLAIDGEADALKSWGVLADMTFTKGPEHLQLPALPMMDLSDVTWTLAAPEMLPSTKMMAAPAALAAAVSSLRLLTVTCLPPAPPVVLRNMVIEESLRLEDAVSKHTRHSVCSIQQSMHQWPQPWRTETGQGTQRPA